MSAATAIDMSSPSFPATAVVTIPTIRVGRSTTLTVTDPAKKAARVAAAAARVERIAAMSARMQTLKALHATFTIPTGFSPNEKHQKRLNKLAELKNKHVADEVKAIGNAFTAIFKNSVSDGLTEIHNFKKIKHDVRAYNRAVNYFNQRSAELRKLSDAEAAKLAQFEQFIRANVFPSYDNTNGFETDDITLAHIEALGNPVPAKIVCELDQSEIELANEDESFPLGYFILKGSRHTTIVATQEEAGFKGAIEYLINKATLLNYDDEFTIHGLGKRFIPPYTAKIGGFFGYLLQFDLEHNKMYSTCDEMRLRMTSPELLTWYNTMCKRRIIQLILARDKSIEYHDKLVFCQTPGCTHADGFMYNNRPNAHRSHAACPAGHAFCVMCNKAEHHGPCAELDDDSRAVALLPGHKLCPTCKTAIFKNGGCNHMQCGSCHQHFCWLCSRRFTASEQYVAHAGCSQFD